MSRCVFRLVWAGVLCALLPISVRADLIMSAPPRESIEEGKKTYEPLAKLIGEVIGEKVIYQPPNDWAAYSNEMRDGKYDIVFDGPHFAAWRMKHLRHTPMVKLPGTLDFVVVARWDDKQINKLRHMASKPVCALPSPNLGTTLLLSQFDNAVLAPQIVEIKGGFPEVAAAFKEGKCRAAVVNEGTYKKLSDADKKIMKVIYKSDSFPNQTVTVGERVNAQVRGKLVAELTKKQLPAGENIFNQFSKSAKFFLPAETDDYQDMESLLEGVVWGW